MPNCAESVPTSALDASETSELVAVLTPWLIQQRWYVRAERPEDTADERVGKNDAPTTSARIIRAIILSRAASGRTIFALVAHAERLYSVPLFIERLAEVPSAASLSSSLSSSSFSSSSAGSCESIGIIHSSDGGSQRVFDATEHPSGQMALLRATLGDVTPADESTSASNSSLAESAATAEAGATSADTAPASHVLTGVALREPFTALPPVISSHKLTSEQSNTSIIYDFAPGSHPAGLIVKVLRLVQAGRNPDVELETALDQASPDSSSADHYGHIPVVPHQYGYATIRYPQEESNATGAAPARSYASGSHIESGSYRESAADVMVASEFLAGSSDAWQLFTRALTSSAANSGTPSPSTLTPGAATPDTSAGASPAAAPTSAQPASASIGAQPTDEFARMSADIAALGALTRAMHSQLAAACTQVEPTEQMRRAQLKSWQERANHALELARELEPLRSSITAIYERAARIPWPPLQRIHGDYHLGQVLRTRTGSWRVIDFEGEPLRALSERTAPDLALRDVAGMLRSLSYAAGYARKNGARPDDMDHWERSAHETFLRSYSSLSPTSSLSSAHPLQANDRLLLTALVLDKALYEVAYEAAYRPEWVDIPISGAHALVKNTE